MSAYVVEGLAALVLLVFGGLLGLGHGGGGRS